jgi:hypothetical protein
MAIKESKKFVNDEFYDYRVLYDFFTKEDIIKYKTFIRKEYKKLIDKWDININSEYIIRNYLSIKMIIASTILSTSYDYSQNNNLKVVEPYLQYYTLLTTFRGLIFTLPNVKWDEGKIFSLSHKKKLL